MHPNTSVTGAGKTVSGRSDIVAGGQLDDIIRRLAALIELQSETLNQLESCCDRIGLPTVPEQPASPSHVDEAVVSQLNQVNRLLSRCFSLSNDIQAQAQRVAQL